MKIVLIAMIWALTGWAKETPAEWTAGVTVCMDPDSHGPEIRSARKLASQVLMKIGLRLDWRPLSRCSRGDLQITLSSRALQQQAPEAFAYALPYEGSHIVVFYDEVQKLDSQLRTSALAYIFVHEVVHILQGIARHSKDGIMKRLWDADDWFQIQTGRLGFTPEDVDLIGLGLEARERNLKSPALEATY